MIYRFVIVSDEAPGFRRDIKIDAGARFIDLNNAIIDSVAYARNELSCFYICDDEWRKQNEVHVMDMRMNPEEDIYLMDETYLDELLFEEGQKLKFVFDMLGERAFFMELRAIMISEDLEKAEITRREGDPPKQLTTPEELLLDDAPKGKKTKGLPKQAADEPDDDYGFDEDEELFTSLDELDEDGYSINEY